MPSHIFSYHIHKYCSKQSHQIPSYPWYSHDYHSVLYVYVPSGKFNIAMENKRIQYVNHRTKRAVLHIYAQVPEGTVPIIIWFPTPIVSTMFSKYLHIAAMKLVAYTKNMIASMMLNIWSIYMYRTSIYIYHIISYQIVSYQSITINHPYINIEAS